MARKQRKTPVNQAVSSPPASAYTRGLQATAYPDVWAELLKLMVDGHAFDLKGREFQRQIIRDESDWIVNPKGAQMGFTTLYLVRTFHWIVKRRWHHLYLMPLKTGAIPFVQGRIDPVIQSNPDLAAKFKTVDNRLHKQTTENIALRIRGTNIWTELREIPSDVLVMDERDKMIEDNIPEAMARLDGSHIKRVVELSTPTAPGHGVDAEDAWPASDQHRWYVPCPHCSRRQTFTVDENVVIQGRAEDCFLRCAFCKKPISDVERAEANAFGSWEAENPGGTKRGYHINQLHSPTQTIALFMANYFAGLRETKKMRAWFNNNRGEAYVAFGDQITPEMLDKCRVKGGTLGGIPNGPIYVGVDVGNVLHVYSEVRDRFGNKITWDLRIFADKPGESMWAQLDKYLSGLSYFNCVIDAHPEKSHAQALSRKYHKRVWLGFEMDRPQQHETAVFNNPSHGDVGKVTIDRTAAFDDVINFVMHGKLHLPADARDLGELMPNLAYNGFYHHLCQMVRNEYEQAATAAAVEAQTYRPVIARWLKNKNPDHWHHALMFCDIASRMKPHMAYVSAAVGELFARSGNVVAAA